MFSFQRMRTLEDGAYAIHFIGAVLSDEQILVGLEQGFIPRS